MVKDIKYASAICIINEDRLLLVKQKHGARHADHWGPPAGRRENEESFLEIAGRELEEETGLKGLPLYLYEIAIWDDEEKATILALYKTVITGKIQIILKDKDISDYVWASKDDVRKGTFPLRDKAFTEIIIRAFTAPAIDNNSLNFYKR
jgi:8-oxo-dGTP pyrophosphatase MutT (NUDIX family)